MMRVTLKNVKELDKLLKRLDRLKTISLEQAAEIGRKYMISYIDDNRVRPQRRKEDDYTRMVHKHLSQSITVVKDSKKAVIGTNSVGIGDIEKMNRETPYWYVTNYGKYVPPPAIGYFGDGNPPNPGMEGEKFINRDTGYLMKPKKSVPAMEYIEATVGWLNSNMAKYAKEEFESKFGKGK